MLVDLLAGLLDRTRYAGLLAGLHRFHAGSLTTVAHADRALGIPRPGAAQAARVQLLEDDLQTLGAQFRDRRTDALPLDGSPSWAAGYAYAVNGSSIGGRVMHGALDPMFGAGSAGRSFFRGLPGESGRWRDFCQRLDRLGAEAPILDAATDGAHQAFRDFRSCVEHS